jgi:GT2 family glycosyltransferase/glycosyltransferase involved in cell wall biosynthesis
MRARDVIFRVLLQLAPEGTLRRRWLRQARRRLLPTLVGASTLFGPTARQRLRQWQRENDLSRAGLDEQRRRPWPAHAPTISLIIPIQTKRDVSRALRMITRQTYSRWEAVFVSDAGCASWVEQATRHDRERVRCAAAAGEQGLDEARQTASGAWIGVISPNDVLAPNALADMADHLLRHPEDDVVYCDEDCLSQFGRRHGLRLKPDWSPDMLLGFNYIGRLCLIRREALANAGGFDHRFAGAQEYEALLRVTSQTERIGHVARCLYHRRAPWSARPDFTRGSGPARLRERAVREHLQCAGLAAEASTLANGMTRARWQIAAPPLVSIIIPTLNQPKILKQCVEDLRHKTDYPCKEIILVDNGSTDAEVLKYYRELTAAKAATIVSFPREFNYSEACNLGAGHASGELLLFLNNDVSVIEPDWLEEMVRFAVRPGVGCVGAKLLYPDGLVQHAGVVVGLNLCGLLYNRVSDDHCDEFGSPNMYRNLLAIMGACQMVKREAFESVGGFDERYRIAQSDVALCLRMASAGWRTVYTPHAALYHHEGHTRGRSNPTEDIELTCLDLQELRINEDPYFHPALCPHHSAPQLRLRPDMGPREFLKYRTRELGRLPAGDVALDLFDDEQLRRLLGTPPNYPAWSATDVIRQPRDAARLALHLLRTSAKLRQRFPRALSEGVQSAYCRWLCQEATVMFGLPASAAAPIEMAFRQDWGARVRGVYASRWTDREMFADVTASAGRAGFFRWLLTHGQRLYGFRDEEIWWFLLQSAEDPVAELIFEYSISPAWQSAFPEAMTDLGWPRFYRWAQPFCLPNADPLDVPALRSTLGPFEQLRLAYDRRPRWRAKFPEAFQNPENLSKLTAWLGDESNWRQGEFQSAWVERLAAALANGERPARGVNVIAQFGAHDTATDLVGALQLAGVATTVHPVPAVTNSSRPRRDHYEIFDVSLLQVRPEPLFDRAYRLANLRRERDRYRVALWRGEVGEPGPEWQKQARGINEFWAPSRYSTDALRRTFDQPVVAILPGLELGPIASVSRRRFDIPDDRFLFLFFFDAAEGEARQNPTAIIEAFRQAFRRDDRVHLAIVVANGRGRRGEVAPLIAVGHDAGVQIIDAGLPRDEALGLLRCADCFVSLHRSTSLGLTLAEAMLLGKPVIATAYSGNLDFMTEHNSLLVDFELSPAREDHAMSDKSWAWASPAVAHAAQQMRWVFERRDDARALGERARETAERLFSLEAAGARMLSRLQEIEQLRQQRLERRLAA